jgi:hypothetical protein
VPSARSPGQIIVDVTAESSRTLRDVELEPEQEQLLADMVEAARKVPRHEQRWHYGGEHMGDDVMAGPWGTRRVLGSDVVRAAAGRRRLAGVFAVASRGHAHRHSELAHALLARWFYRCYPTEEDVRVGDYLQR